MTVPSAHELVEATSAVRLSRKADLEQSIDYLRRRVEVLRRYDFIDDLAIDAFDSDAPTRQAALKEASALVHHLTVVRSALAQALWTRQMFIGFSALDELLLGAAKEDDADGPVATVCRTIVERSLYLPGLVVYPLHSFGVLGAGFASSIRREHISLMSNEFGFVVTPQTNSMERTFEVLDEACDALGVRKAAPRDLLEHWERSRAARWMYRNPLLIARVSTVPGGYYDNQFLLLGRLRITATLLTMLSALQPRSDERAGHLFSSARINNFETLDIKHYMVLSDLPSDDDELEGQLVPMSASSLALAELSDMPVEFHPDHWLENLDEARRISEALEYLYEETLSRSFGQETSGKESRVFRKVTRSLTFFLRSFTQSDEEWQSIVSLAIAFETLVTDSYAPGVQRRVVRRVRALSPPDREKEFTAAVNALYSARGRLMHGEEIAVPTTLQDAQRAFVYTVVGLLDRIPNSLSSAPGDAPLGYICGDSDPMPGWRDRLRDALRWARRQIATARRRAAL